MFTRGEGLFIHVIIPAYSYTTNKTQRLFSSQEGYGALRCYPLAVKASMLLD